MKTTPNSFTPATPNFPGIVIDPNSGRKCALQQDIFKGLGLQGEQVSKTGARIYQNRYYDVLDVLEARSKVGSKRGRKAGIIIGLAATLATALAGGALRANLISSIGEVGAREMLVRAIEELGFSSAVAIRKQWEAQKIISNGRISDLETLNTEGSN